MVMMIMMEMMLMMMISIMMMIMMMMMMAVVARSKAMQKGAFKGDAFRPCSKARALPRQLRQYDWQLPETVLLLVLDDMLEV